MNMTLLSLKKALSVKSALIRYNRRYKCSFLERDLYVIYIMKTYDFPINRLKILTMLSKTSRTMNYRQLNICLDLLISENFIQQYETTKQKKYIVTPAGLVFLLTIEEWARKMRLDKIS